MFTPKIGEDCQFDYHTFQMGWFNHQPVRIPYVSCGMTISTTRPGTAQPAAGLEIREAKGMGVYVKAQGWGDFSTGPNGGRSWKLLDPSKTNQHPPQNQCFGRCISTIFQNPESMRRDSRQVCQEKSHRIHVWHIYPHLVDFLMEN